VAEQRSYEIVFIINPDAEDAEVMRLTEAAQKIITDQGGNIVKTEMMGKRRLAYEINHQRDGVYVLLEVEGSGREIAEFERRMRVNDRVLRYMRPAAKPRRQYPRTKTTQSRESKLPRKRTNVRIPTARYSGRALEANLKERSYVIKL
jgi:small subunit ribosomal protein S6